MALLRFCDLFSIGEFQVRYKIRLCFVTYSSVEVCCLGNKDISNKRKKKKCLMRRKEGKSGRNIAEETKFHKAIQVSEGEI